jgi:putative transposase
MKRHSRIEVATKLHQATEMARRGQRQGAICKALGISVMTFHRWRKEFGDQSDVSPLLDGPGSEEDSGMTQAQIEDLRVENRRLRKIVTDLLLEKSKLDESLLRRKTRA